ncbi:MAG: AAA family ATPase, partial [Peptococcaceae bacterium]|nr:AAA family ATPase [Peptococcaceae bacterium]
MRKETYMDVSPFEDALKTVAQICEGYSTITDRSGNRIITFDPSGAELTEMRGAVYDLAREAGETGQIKIGFSQIVNDAQTWAIPFGDYVIAASNVAKIARDQALVNSLDQALPFIAQLVGGEAVIFDKNGRRLNTVDAGGKVIEKQIGALSKLARKAMDEQKPV